MRRKDTKGRFIKLVEKGKVKEAELVLAKEPGELPIDSDEKLGKLTKSERKLLITLCEPRVAEMNVDQICELADISRDTYYRAYKNPLFVEMQSKLALSIIKQSMAPLIHTGIKQAQKGSFFHWKALLEMVSAYDPKRGPGTALVPEGEQTGEGEIVIRFASPNRSEPDKLPFTDLDDPEEVAELLEALEYEPDDE